MDYAKFWSINKDKPVTGSLKLKAEKGLSA